MKPSVSAGRPQGAGTFVSRLATGTERFLAHVIDHGLATGIRRPTDFFRHFPPHAIMNALAGEPELRAALLVETTGIKRKIALRKPVQAAGDDLALAFEEGEADHDAVLDIFGPDDRVRFLDHGLLWSYMSEGDFWEVEGTDASNKSAVGEHIRVLLSRALEEELLDHRAMLEPLTVERLVRALPGMLVTKVIERAISDGAGASPFTYEAFLDVVTIDKLVEHIQLPVLWNEIVVPKIARECGLLRRGNPSGPIDVRPTNGLGETTATTPAAAPIAASSPASSSTASLSSSSKSSNGKKNGNGKSAKVGKTTTSAAKAPTGSAASTAASPSTLGKGAGPDGGGLDINDDVFAELGSDSDLMVEVASDGDVDVIDDVIDELSDDLGRTL